MTDTRTLHIIKQGGLRESEAFSHQKLHSSVEAACLSVRSPEGEAETIATRVVDAVLKWSEHKASVTSDDLRRIATRGLEIFHPEAAYLYQQHNSVI